MTRDEALKLLRGGKKGVTEWNRWRDVGEKVPSLLNANFVGADLKDADLSGVNLSGADLGRADLGRADLQNAILSGAVLLSANLSGAFFGETNLRDATLRGANLSGASILGAILNGADLSNADLSYASLLHTVLKACTLTTTNLANTRWGWTTLAELDLRTARGLDSAEFSGPCSIGVDTLVKSNGQIPESFLRGCGFRDEEIEYFRGAVGSPIRFYSCFISYCTDDEAFATRLHNDFQDAGIRCWKWDHDARTGEELFGEINQAIRIHDKVVLIASKHSLTSAPVNREIERAIQEEDRRAKLKSEGKWRGVPSVLFPVRLDNYVFEEAGDGTPMWDHPRRADVLKKMIADGEGWETDNKKYETVRDRLIRDMKPGAT